MHGLHGGLLGAVTHHGLIEVERGGVHRAIGAAAVERNVDIGAAQLVGGEERRATELGQVGQDGHLYSGLEAAVVVQRLHGLGEDHVRTRFHVGHGTLDGGIHAFRGSCIRAGHDDKAVIGAGIHGGLHAVDHFFGGHDLLARAVATALLADLVFHVHSRHTCLDERANGACDVEGATPAGVDVDHQRHLHGVGNAARVDQHVFHRADAQVRNTE